MLDLNDKNVLISFVCHLPKRGVQNIDFRNPRELEAVRAAGRALAAHFPEAAGVLASADAMLVLGTTDFPTRRERGGLVIEFTATQAESVNRCFTPEVRKLGDAAAAAFVEARENARTAGLAMADQWMSVGHRL